METTHTIAMPISLEYTKAGSPKITDRDGFSIANLSNTVHKHRIPQGERIVTCVNALKGVSDPSKAIAEAKDLLKEVYQDAINDGENFQYYAEYYSTKIKQVLASLGEEVE